MKRFFIGAIALLTISFSIGITSAAAQNKNKAMANAINKTFNGIFVHISAAQLQPQSMSQFMTWLKSADMPDKTKQNFRNFFKPAKELQGQIKVIKVNNATYQASQKKGDAFLIFIHENAQSKFSVQADMVKVIETGLANSDDDDDCRFEQGEDCFCANDDNCDCVSCTGCGCGGCGGCGSSGSGENEVLDMIVW